MCTPRKNAGSARGPGLGGIERNRVFASIGAIFPLLALTAFLFASNSAQGQEFDIPYHPTQIIVRFQPGITAAVKDQARAAVPGAQSVWQSHIIDGLEVVEVPEGQVPSAVLAFREQPGVLHTSAGYELSTAEIPNDPLFAKLWGLHNVGQTIDDRTGVADADIDAPEAWDIWTPAADCRIAVMDTGVEVAHADLYKNIWINQGEIPPAIRAQLTDVDGDGLITFSDLNDPVN